AGPRTDVEGDLARQVRAGHRLRDPCQVVALGRREDPVVWGEPGTQRANFDTLAVPLPRAQAGSQWSEGVDAGFVQLARAVWRIARRTRRLSFSISDESPYGPLSYIEQADAACPLLQRRAGATWQGQVGRWAPHRREYRAGRDAAPGPRVPL